jgi:hypothetical protein
MNSTFLRGTRVAGIGLVLLSAVITEARAQTMLRAGNPSATPASMARGMSGQVAPTSIAPNTVVGAIVSPPVGGSGALNPAISGLSNPYASLSSTPYGGGYGTGDLGAAYPGIPYYGYGESPIGGYMRGTADIVSAQGKWMQSLQQASLTKQQVRQSMIDTQRKSFDEYYYERKNTPTFESDREAFNNQQLLRSLNNPPESEITSGQALNDVLDDLVRLNKDRGLRAPAPPLDEDVLRRLNLTPGSGNGNAGLLKNDARLTWPLALRDDGYKTDRELVNSLAPEAVHQAINGRVDAGTLRELSAASQRLRQNVTANIRDMTANQYTEASRFLGYLDNAIRALGRPDAGDYFTRKYTAQGKDVAELVRNLAAKGLRFAPATPGDEGAYVAVHRALAAYDRAAKGQVVSDSPGSDSKP